MVSALDSQSLFSIVIVNYNGERFIQSCLDSILRTNYPNFEVIVVDNNSFDGSIEILKQYQTNPKIKARFIDKNLHFAGGNNKGIEAAKGDFVFFLNFDTKVTPNWLSEVYKIFQLNQDVAAVQSLLLRPDGKTVDSMGGTIDYCGKLFSAKYLWARNSVAAETRQLFYGCGAGLCLRRTVLQKIGYFDPATPTDEVDICWRIQLSGDKVMLAPKSVVYHYRSGAFGKSISKQRVFYGEIGALYSILKNYEIKSIFFAMPYLGFFLFASLWADLAVRRKPDVVLFRIKAYAHVLRHLPQILQKRAFAQQLRTVSDKEIRHLLVRPNLKYFLDSL